MNKLFYIDPMSYRNMAEYDSFLLKEIEKNNTFEIFYFCSCLFSPAAEFKDVKLFKFFKYSLIENSLIKFFSYQLSWFRVFILALFHRPDVIHVQWIRVPHIDIIYFILLKLLTSAKIVYTAHNALPHNSGVRFKTVFKYIYMIFDRIIVHTSKTKSDIKSFSYQSDNKIVVIPHGMLSKSLINNSNTLDFDFENDSVDYLIIGEISPYKGVLDFIDIWKKVNICSSKFKNRARLQIYGRCSQEYSREIMNQIGSDKNIDFIPGELSDLDFDIKLSAAHIVVLPYKVCSQSGVLLKALHYKKIPLVSNVGGLDEPFTVAKIGWVFDWSVNDNLKKTLLKSLNDFLDREFITPNSTWNHLADYYSWHEIAKRTVILYQSN